MVGESSMVEKGRSLGRVWRLHVVVGAEPRRTSNIEGCLLLAVSNQVLGLLPILLPIAAVCRSDSLQAAPFALLDAHASTDLATMSLFGDSPTGTPPHAARSKQSLFDDDAPKRSSASLFADDAVPTADSPWSLPTPKKAARGNLLKSLLPSSEVPEMYVDACDKLLAMEGSSSGVGSNAVRVLLEESGIDTDAQQTILGTVLPDETKQLGRNETNVLIALIGLAQEGEEITLDGVDERRKSECQASPS
jgi:hypothetical protein